MKFLVTYIVLLSFSFAVGFRNHPNTHIAGGNRVPPSDRPYPIWITTLKNRSDVKNCHGARLSDMWFLTAAECLDQNSHPYEEVRIVYSYYSYQALLFYNVRNFKYRIHPQYNAQTRDNNIGLIKCGNCFDVDQSIFPVLPTKTDQYKTFVNRPAVVSGWIDDRKTHEWYLNTFDTKVIDPYWCGFFQSPPEPYFHICASGWFRKGLTQNDVGAPIVITEPDNTIKLIGIASSVNSWAQPFSLPMVFTKVAPYLTWIHRETNLAIQD